MTNETMSDGVQHPQNNCSNLPPVGSPEWEARLDAELAARALAGSGINHARASVLAADRAAAEKTRGSGR